MENILKRQKSVAYSLELEAKRLQQAEEERLAQQQEQVPIPLSQKVKNGLQSMKSHVISMKDWSHITWIRIGIIVSLVFIVVIIGLVFRKFISKYTFAFLAWVKGLGVWGGLIMIVTYAVCTVFFIPGSVLTIASGFLWGLATALPIISAGSTLGATLAFIAGRTLVRKAVEKKIKRYEKFHAIDKAIAQEGWKIVFLLRLIPLVPFTLLNYALALTDISLQAYVVSSWVGMMPGTVLYVYFGSSAKDLAEIVSGKVSTGGIGVKIGIMVLSGVLIVGVFVLFVKIGRRAMDKYLKSSELSKQRYIHDTDASFVNLVVAVDPEHQQQEQEQHEEEKEELTELKMSNERSPLLTDDNHFMPHV